VVDVDGVLKVLPPKHHQMAGRGEKKKLGKGIARKGFLEFIK
jgi:hypothetical protein